MKLRLSLIEVASKFKMVNLQLSVVISLVYTWVVVSFAIFKHSQNIFVTFTAAFKYKLLLTIAIYAPILCVKVTNLRCKCMIRMQLFSYLLSWEPWRSGSTADSQPEGDRFESRRGQYLFWKIFSEDGWVEREKVGKCGGIAKEERI